MDNSTRYATLPACSFLNAVEFCPYENASNILAYASLDSLRLCTLTQEPGAKMAINSSQVKLTQSLEKLVVLNYSGISCMSWSPVTSMRYLPRCGKLAVGMYNSEVCVFTTDFKDETSVITLKGHKKPVNSVAFEPTVGVKLASTGDDHTCRVWDVEAKSMLHCIPLLHAGMDVSWNKLEPGKLMVSEQSGRINFYDCEDLNQSSSFHPVLTLVCDRGTLTSSDWSVCNPLKVGAAVGTEWIIWDISKSVLPEESRQAHSNGCIKFRWSRHDENIFLTQGRPKHTVKFHHLDHREAIFQEINSAGLGASWHFRLPICAVPDNNTIKLYDLDAFSR